MVKQIYLALAALVILAMAVNAAPAQKELEQELDEVNHRISRRDQSSEEVQDDEDDDEEQDDDDSDEHEQSRMLRLRREAEKEPIAEPTKVEPAEEVSTQTEVSTSAPAAEKPSIEAGSTVTVSTTRKPVLVLIRDALKKVTAGLPTEQVANNALQYFQLFEHFIQQTIEQALTSGGDDDEDDTDEDRPDGVLTAGQESNDKATEAPETQTEKQVETDSDSTASSTAVPAKNEVKPAEQEAATNEV